MFYIFLDIDGVLNKESEWNLKYHINKNCVQILKDIVDSIIDNVSIVLTSTWKNGYSKDGHHSPQISKLISVLNEYELNISDITPITNKGRQAEVEYYIRRHNITKYLVLDDDISLFENPKMLNLYVVNYKTGLISNDIKNIQRRL